MTSGINSAYQAYLDQHPDYVPPPQPTPVPPAPTPPPYVPPPPPVVVNSGSGGSSSGASSGSGTGTSGSSGAANYQPTGNPAVDVPTLASLGASTVQLTQYMAQYGRGWNWNYMVTSDDNSAMGKTAKILKDAGITQAYQAVDSGNAKYYEFKDPANPNKTIDIPVVIYDKATPQQQFAIMQKYGVLPPDAKIVTHSDGTWGYTSSNDQSDSGYTNGIPTDLYNTYVQNKALYAKYNKPAPMHFDYAEHSPNGESVIVVTPYDNPTHPLVVANLDNAAYRFKNNNGDVSINQILNSNTGKVVLQAGTDGKFNDADIYSALSSGSLSRKSATTLFGSDNVTRILTNPPVKPTVVTKDNFDAYKADKKNGVPDNATFNHFDEKTMTLFYDVPAGAPTTTYSDSNGINRQSYNFSYKPPAPNAEITAINAKNDGLHLSVDSVLGKFKNYTITKTLMDNASYNIENLAIGVYTTEEAIVKGFKSKDSLVKQSIAVGALSEAASGGTMTGVVVIGILAAVGITAYSQRQNIQNAIDTFRARQGRNPTASEIKVTDKTGHEVSLATIIHNAKPTTGSVGVVNSLVQNQTKPNVETMPLHGAFIPSTETIPTHNVQMPNTESMPAHNLKAPSVETMPTHTVKMPSVETFPLGVEAPSNGPVNAPPHSKPAQEPKTEAGKQLQQQIKARQALENSVNPRSMQKALQNIGDAIDNLDRKARDENANPKTEEGKKIKSEVQAKQTLENSVTLRAQRIALQNIADSLDAQERAAASKNSIPKTEAGKQIKTEIQAQMTYENSVSLRNQRIALENVNNAISAMERAEKARNAMPTTQAGQQIKAETQARAALENSVNARNRRIALENIDQAIAAIERAERAEHSTPKTEAGKQIKAEIQARQAYENSVNLRNQRIALETIDQNMRRQEYAQTLENANPKTEAGKQIKTEYLQKLKEEYVVNEIIRHWNDEYGGTGGAGTGILMATMTGTGTGTSVSKRATATQIAHDIVSTSASSPFKSISNGKYVTTLTIATLATLQAQRQQLTKKQTAAAVKQAIYINTGIQNQTVVKQLTYTAEQIATQTNTKAGLYTMAKIVNKESIKTNEQITPKEITKPQTKPQTKQATQVQTATDTTTENVKEKELEKEQEKENEKKQDKFLKPPSSKSEEKPFVPTEQDIKNATTVKAGFGWWMRFPNGQWKFYKKLPPGATGVKPGKGSGYASVQTIQGEPIVTSKKIGFENVVINRPSHQPGKAGAIKYSPQPKGRPGLSVERHGEMVHIRGVGIANRKKMPRGRILR